MVETINDNQQRTTGSLRQKYIAHGLLYTSPVFVH